jgi:hypothetical protein
VDPVQVFADLNRKNAYLEALYDWALDWLGEDNGQVGADDGRAVVRGKDTNAKAWREYKDEAVRAHTFRSGYEAGLKVGKKVKRRPGKLKRGAAECGLLRKQRARVGLNWQWERGEETGRRCGGGGGAVGRGRARARWRKRCCNELDGVRNREQDRRRWKLAVVVRERQMDREAALAAAATVQKKRYRKRNSLGSLTLVGTRETSDVEKREKAEMETPGGTEGLWTRISRILQKVRGFAGGKRPGEAARDPENGGGAEDGQKKPAGEAWWVVRR